VVQADVAVCIAMTETHVYIQGRKMKCLTGRDLTGYDYVSIGRWVCSDKCKVGNRCDTASS
jgi:hypothetical protein